MMSLQTLKPWSVTEEKAAAAVKRIVEVAAPRKIVLFGSFVDGRPHPDSDLDVLVIVGDGIQSPRKESVRIRRELRGIMMPIDVLVAREGDLSSLAEQKGLIFKEILDHGQVVYEAQSW